MITDRPKLLGDTTAIHDRLDELQAPHIAPLTAFVEDLRLEVGTEAKIPYFDPWDGGVDATVLFLLEAPGPKAVRSGFVSRNNPDESAKNFHELSAEAGIDRKKTVIWNIVPWYIGDGKKIRPASAEDLADGLKNLPRLMALLQKLRKVVLVGRKAEKAAAPYLRCRYTVFTCPHPSPLFVNNAPANRGKILAALKLVATGR